MLLHFSPEKSVSRQQKFVQQVFCKILNDLAFPGTIADNIWKQNLSAFKTCSITHLFTENV